MTLIYTDLKGHFSDPRSSAQTSGRLFSDVGNHMIFSDTAPSLISDFDFSVSQCLRGRFFFPIAQQKSRLAAGNLLNVLKVLVWLTLIASCCFG
jgi:hypothetical protein